MVIESNIRPKQVKQMRNLQMRISRKRCLNYQKATVLVFLVFQSFLFVIVYQDISAEGSEEKVVETTFENPTVAEIKQAVDNDPKPTTEKKDD